MGILVSLDEIQGPRWRSIAASVLLGTAAGTAFGWWAAFTLTRLPSGYIVPYTNLSVLVVSLFLCFPGVFLVAYSSTRGIGLALIFAGVLSLVTYNVGWKVLLRLGRIPWRPPAIRLVAGQQNYVVIHFKDGVTEEEGENFLSSKLAFMPYWATSLRRIPETERQQPDAIELDIPNKDVGGTKARRSEEMLENDISGFMVTARRDSRVASVEVESRP
jgi:hypothetical protein